MLRRGRLIAVLLSCAFLAAVALYACAGLWLPALATFLIHADPPRKADLIVVLAGDPSGNRILKAAELIRDGYAPKALVSGPDNQYGCTEDQYAIAYTERKGFPRSWFIGLPNHSRSTEREADVIVAELQNRKVRSIDLVTSATHTRRAWNAYRKRLGDIQLSVVAAPEAEFTPRAWWKQREGRKAIFFEWTKTIATWLGL
ncbi:MAG TPA: YdcF family protein [Bryobacteraceae bacterium]|nr:YdcF family protein [Bryobacteraceae bacterium]